MGILKIDVDTSNFDLKINALRKGIETMGPRVIKETTENLEENLKIITPVKTGKLKNSIRSVVYGLTGEVSTNSGYGLFVDVDTKPHMIFGNPFLRIPLGNKTIFARKVFHPGTTGQHLRERAMRYTKGQVADILSRMFLEEVRT